MFSEQNTKSNELSQKTAIFNMGYGGTYDLSRPSTSRPMIIFGGRDQIGFCIFVPPSESEYYQISNSGILTSVNATGDTISLEIGSSGYGSSLAAGYLIL